MPRMPRISLEGALYYLTSRGNHEQKIFNDQQDYHTYLELLEKYKKEYGFKLFSYVLLPNHLHLLMEIKEGITISEIMHALNSSYTKYFNGKYNRQGHVLQGRYKLNLLEKGPYLLYMTAYLHLNPYRLGLVKDSKECSYSSLPFYFGTKGKVPMDEELREVTDLLDEQKTYEDFLKNIPKGDLEALGKKLHNKRILGSDEFKKIVKEEIERYESQIQGGKRIMSKKLILTGSVAIASFLIASVFLFGINRKLKKNYDKVSQIKEKEYSEKLESEKKKARANIQEFYAANMVSYKAMAKRLEIEKNKVKKLEEEVKKEDGQNE